MPARQPNQAETAVADRIIEMLDRGELPPWSRPWRLSARSEARNALTRHAYRGINRWMTAITQEIFGYDDNRWLTARQAQKAGGSILQDQQHTPIIFWKFITPKKNKSSEADQADAGQETNSRRKGYPVARLYRLYNVAQTTGCDLPEPDPDPEPAEPIDPIAAAEAIIAAMPNPPRISFYSNSNQAPHYLPVTDHIRVPDRDRFHTAELFYNTMFHEMTHATGHQSRLNRLKVGDRTDLHSYGTEELVAGMGAAMLADHAGLSHATIETDASYIKHWRDTINADKRIVAIAGQRAEKAYAYITADGAPPK